MKSNIFKQPVLQNRENGSLPKTNTLIGDIENVFEIFDCDSFHFFSKRDENKNVYALPIVWKVLLLKNNDYTLNIEKELLYYVGEEQLIKDLKIYNSYNLKLEYIIFYDDVNWKETNQNIYAVSVSYKQNELSFDTKLYTKQEFEKYLFEINEESMVMKKPLIYSQTKLERYLSEECQFEKRPVNRAFFPGDIDCLIKKEDKFLYLIEFKKHSIDGSIEEESYKKYWGRDIKKYSAINAMSKKLGLNCFYNFIYSTKQDLNKIKIEIIDNNLKLIDSIVFAFKDKKDLEEILQSIFKI